MRLDKFKSPTSTGWKSLEFEVMVVVAREAFGLSNGRRLRML